MKEETHNVLGVASECDIMEFHWDWISTLRPAIYSCRNYVIRFFVPHKYFSRIQSQFDYFTLWWKKRKERKRLHWTPLNYCSFCWKTCWTKTLIENKIDCDECEYCVVVAYEELHPIHRDYYSSEIGCPFHSSIQHYYLNPPQRVHERPWMIKKDRVGTW